MSSAPVLFLPAPLHGFSSPLLVPRPFRGDFSVPFADFRLEPRYPSKSPLDDILRYVNPGTDEYPSEKYAFEIGQMLGDWGRSLRERPPALGVLAKFLHPSLQWSPLVPSEETAIRSGGGVEVLRRRFASPTQSGREHFLVNVEAYFRSMPRIETPEFEIVEIEQTAASPLTVRAEIRFDLVGAQLNDTREQHIGHLRTEWLRDSSNVWLAVKWEAVEETVSRLRGPGFIDVTAQAFGDTESYREQMLRGVDYWRTVLDGACGVDVYGNNGLAVGDYDNDGFDDLYVCQPAGLPNRLYHNRGDGTFEDVTANAGVDVLDATACAVFADFENKGLQDLLAVSASGPLLFLNQGKGRFQLKRDAFKFARPPQGAFTHAAVADYDRDGRLDIYFCLYSYYQGLDQYRYPVPYFDARNGPPNFLLHNQGNAIFLDQTDTARLNVDNDRYSFACAWGDTNSDGWPDLYVANDFGRSNLYRNNGNGTFTSAAMEARVEDPGAGMSACWFDFDNDGNQDIYVANMWSAAGMRVSEQKQFHANDPDTVRAFFRQHAGGNSLYRNLGNGTFKNISLAAGVEMGRWAWASDSWDFDHDGYPDLYITNGYVSGPGSSDVSSFFWRQVVGRSPQGANPSPNYEQGWNAINELIRSDASWSGHERHVLYLNNHDGTFSDVSGAIGMDFADDGRAFALADIDQDGRLEVILKNRTAPQLRILHNAMKDLGHSVVFRLRGTKSNRDAIGAAVTVESGAHRQTKYLQAGSAFLSQHTKELCFGIGKDTGLLHALIRWPSGLTQTFENLPAGHRIEIEEGAVRFQATPFAAPTYDSRTTDAPKPDRLPTSWETLLIEPLGAPEFSLPDLSGTTCNLLSLRGGFIILHFWTVASATSVEQLRSLQQQYSTLSSSAVQVLAMNVDEPDRVDLVRSFAGEQSLSFPVLLGTSEVAGIYNLIYRYLFDRHQDIGIPISFLINPDGMIVKIYQGLVNPAGILEDVRSIPGTLGDRIRKALPFPGTLYQGNFQRNAFTYGVALFQHGYLEPAASSFKQAIAAKPDDPEAHYNLGTLELRRSNFTESRKYLEQALKLRANYPEALNNLGMLAAQQGQPEEAVRRFRQSLALRPDYTTALLNLGNLYRRQAASDEAEKLLSRALELQPDDPEGNYSMGMFYAQQNQLPRASQYLEKAVNLRAEYPDALNNLGVLFIRQQRYSDAEDKFKACIRVAPGFDQAYLNLARLYVLLNNQEKAKTTLQELLRLQPQHKVARQTLEMLH